ncbi:low molecular weight protein-tyrosine-phosphatase [Denitrobaculum tricleocarpae]|uniref:low molecular weight protein-tyrosine-phosphatase n=1 Tax=Denitrobaculum tricleocarpae TaxID=2591009 RepID=UPI001FE2FE3A|nr:low molecular weight protein-tyrosine-phosphatase [Denitrobaculum tricleocarpae]
MAALQVLFVCTGNICRSPSAESVLRRGLEAAGLSEQILVDSAGTHAYHTGDSPSKMAQRSGAKRGYDLSGLRAREVTAEDFENFDVISAMDRGHVEFLRQLCPPARTQRIQLFLNHAPQPLQGQDVPDPYGGGAEDYERTLDLIEEGMKGLIEHLQSRL